MVLLNGYVLLSGILFAIGLYGALTRRHVILVLIGIEIMLNAANLNFVAFWRYGDGEALTGQIVALFGITISAAEMVVGLALVLAIFRTLKTTRMDAARRLKG